MGVVHLVRVGPVRAADTAAHLPCCYVERFCGGACCRRVRSGHHRDHAWCSCRLAPRLEVRVAGTFGTIQSLAGRRDCIPVRSGNPVGTVTRHPSEAALCAGLTALPVLWPAVQLLIGCFTRHSVCVGGRLAPWLGVPAWRISPVAEAARVGGWTRLAPIRGQQNAALCALGGGDPRRGTGGRNSISLRIAGLWRKSRIFRWDNELRRFGHTFADEREGSPRHLLPVRGIL